ncbi:MAG: pilus assembly protein PilM [Candidatus Liptonbacteria bacterium]|nr:pilus assembly protein PilM [Candidatus Liptonbacteria bacterium]
MNADKILSKTLSFLGAKTKIGGLEISDMDLRFAYFNGGALKTAALRLPPGIIENGEIKNYDTLVDALKELRDLIPEDFGKKKLVNAIVTLNSIHIYTHVFSLPLIEDENLKEAVQLNIRMVSPFDISQAYAGWQLITENKNELKMEILSAFAQKGFIDQLREAMTEAGFFPLAVESGALSLARLVREEAVDFQPEKPFLILSVDDKGVRFLILRMGQLHFEYFQSWKDIQGDAKNISWPNFEDAIKRNLNQVINFYRGHWEEPLDDVLIASNSLVEEISKTIRENFSINARELKLKFQESFRREWYEVAGSAIRGDTPRAEDKDVNLFGMTVQEDFRKRQILDFLRFWEILMSSSLSIMIVFMLISYLFLMNLGKSIQANSPFTISNQQMQEINALEAQIDDFNSSVKMLSELKSSTKPKTSMLVELNPLLNLNGIVIDRLYSQSGGLPAVLSGETDSQDKILSFKNSLSEGNYFSSVNLSLPDIKAQENGRLSFIISFKTK